MTTIQNKQNYELGHGNLETGATSKVEYVRAAS